MTAGQKAIVVLGPGRSGTSALTRAVAALGVELGGNLKAGTSKNARGFFEDLDILELNYDLHEAFDFVTEASRPLRSRACSKP